MKPSASARFPDAVTSSSSSVLDSKLDFKDIPFNNDDDDDDDDDDDPVVRTIDVYLSPALLHSLHLLQFPVEPAYPSHHLHHGAYDKHNIAAYKKKTPTPTAARYRPKHSMLELDYTVVVNHPSSSSNNSMRLLASNHDKRNLQTRTHASNSIEHVTHSALAKLDSTGTRLNIVPLRSKSVFQMRPTFHHLHDPEEDGEEEGGEEKDGNNNEEIDNIIDEDEGEGIDDTNRRPIMFAKKEIDPSAGHGNNATSSSSSSRRNAYAQKRAEEASEEWLELSVLQGSGNYATVGRGSSSSSSMVVMKELMDKVQCEDVENELRLLPFAAHSGKRVGSGDDDDNHIDGLDNDDDGDDDDGGAYYVKSLNYLDSYSTGRASGETYVEDLSDWTPSLTAVVVGSADHQEEDAYGMDESSLALGMEAGEGSATERATAELAAKLAILLQHGNGTMFPYCVLRSRFQRKTVSDSMLLAALSSCAVLVRGNFALKSSLAKFLHASATTRTATRAMAHGSGIGGSEGQKLHAKSMNDLRDLILLLLNMHGAIQRERLMYVYSNHSWIKPDTITFVLNTVAKRTSREESCWVAKVDDDEEFAAKFPEVAACHAMYWMKRKEMLMDSVRLYETAK